MISRAAHSHAVRRQLVGKKLNTSLKDVAVRRRTANSVNTRPIRYFSISSEKKAPGFQSFGFQPNQILDDAQWLIPRKGTGELMKES